MTAIKNHIFAIQLSLKLLFQGKFLLFFIPGIVIAVFFLMYAQGLESANSALGVVSYVPWVGEYLQAGVDAIFSWIEGISIFIYQFTIITLLSPFHTILSERVDEHQTGRKFEAGWQKFLNDILRTIGVAFLGGLMYMVIKFFWWAFAYLLGISFLDPYISMILLAFFTGFNSYDYSLERYDVSVGKSWGYAFSHPLHMIFTGLIFTACLLIPYVGVVIAPVLLTMVGTMCYLRMDKSVQEKKDELEYL